MIPNQNGQSLQHDSTLACLPKHRVSFQLSQMCHHISEAFEKSAILPGVLLFDHHKLHGIISRTRFLEVMSQPFAKELFYEREIKRISQQFEADFRVFPSKTYIGKAVADSLERNVRDLSEPIVMEDQGNFFVVDTHVLLQAHARIFSKTVRKLRSEIHRSHILQEELQEAYQAAEKTARLDGLTGIPNRRHLDEYFAKEWQRSMRGQTPLSLILFDIDYFKGFNDTYGHQAGDDTLVQVARCLSAQTHRPADMVARYGGEEFMAILPETPAEGALELAERMRLAVSGLRIPNEKSCCNNGYLSVSCGISTINPQQTGSTLPSHSLQMADQALYQAKFQGRNRVILSRDRVSCHESEEDLIGLRAHQ